MAHNLERIGQNWIAYDGAGYAFRCQKSPAYGLWIARPSHAGQAGDSRQFEARLLRDVAAKVAKSFPGWRPYYEVHNLTTQTDSLVGTFASESEAVACRDKWAASWPSNRYEVRRSPDVRIHAIAFGGRAFEPITDDGKAWARNVVSCNPDYPIFRAPDGCMTGFDPDAFGVEPCDFEAFLDDLNAAGLKGEIA